MDKLAHFFIFLAFFSFCSAYGVQKKVLVLQTGNSEFYWTAEQTRGIRESFSLQNQNTYALAVEYLDLVRHSDQEYLTALQNLLLKKYSSNISEVAGIIVSDDAALDFFVTRLNEAFKNVPLVFSGINGKIPDALEKSGREFAGLLEQPNYKETLNIAFHLHPKIKRVIVVGDSRKATQSQVAEIQKLSHQYPAEFIFKGNETFSELADYLENLGEGDIIIRLAYYNDNQGRLMTFNESMHFFSAHSKVPMYSFWEGTVGRGVIGGKLLSGFHHGKAAGNLMRELLRPGRIQDPKVHIGRTHYIFDFDQLKRFQIDHRLLPADSEVINHPYSFYEEHWAMIWIVIGSFAVLTISVIIMLLINTKLRATRIDLLAAKEKAEEASLTKSRFLANMSHEIRTPLGAIVGFSELLLTPDLTEEQKEDYSERIRRNGDILSNLVEDILDLSRVEAGRLQIERIEVYLPDLVNDIMAATQYLVDKKELELRLSSEGKIPATVTTDPIRFRQILTNIIGNAVKFTKKGHVSVTLSYHSGKLRVDVKDTGRGLTDQQAAGLFEPFKQGDASTTRIYGGTGLGLSLSRGLAKMLGGNIELVGYKENEGCHFAVTVDTGEVHGEWTIEDHNDMKKKNNSTLIDPSTQLYFKNTRVLLAEDSLDNQLLIKRYLHDACIHVDIAQNGAEAVDLALKGAYDLILMDIQMPILDGIGATTKLRSAGYKGPILALTAHALTEQRELCLNAGCNAHLTKPIRKVELMEALSTYFKKEAQNLNAFKKL